MIKTIYREELPKEIDEKLEIRIWKLYLESYRKLSNQTGLSINTLRKVRIEGKTSYKTWKILSEKL